MSEVDIELHYALHVMPSGRFPFRRWRFELWHGPRLLVAGWRSTEDHAERALRERAARVAHRLHGLHLLHPSAAHADAPLRHGAAARVTCGAVSCLLVPRSVVLEAAA